MSQEYKVRLEMFEGPLDLLLYLIKRDEIDIYDIPISDITTEYLKYLDVLQELNLNVAGEFLVMAATLMQIKARMLLPKPERGPDEVEEEDPRAELGFTLPSGEFHSLAASNVVGTWTKGTPRMYAAAAKPVRSPTTPPPSSISVVPRSHRCSRSASKIRFSVSQSLCCSPSGSVIVITSTPRASSARMSGAR